DRPYEEHFRNSFDPARSADLLPRFLEFDLPFSGAAGTTHGSPYPHDTHVPMVFLGHGVEAGREPARAWTVDL
ncbi:MAG: alkaline phosphatase family protein, partial [Acidobacteria bacterium]|nr:alkaline phosphatase family protein [Acidobacteriota bacterium]NIQ87206.1 alkaline phosphatase family protein [Acidobacteriota bacterium]